METLREINNADKIILNEYKLYCINQHYNDFFSSPLLDHGKIIKSVNAESADSAEKVTSVVIEEIDVLTKSEPIRNLEIVRTMQYGKCGRSREGEFEWDSIKSKVAEECEKEIALTCNELAL